MFNNLPKGFAARSPTEDDLHALAALDAAHTRQTVGVSLRTENEIRIQWKAPTFDPATDSQVVLSREGVIVGWCEVYDFEPHTRIASRLRLLPGVDERVPRHLVDWAVARARAGAAQAPAGSPTSMTQSAYEGDLAAAARLEATGFRYVRSFLRMRIEMDQPPSAPEWPEGIEVRVLVPGQDDRAAVEAVRDIFQDHWGYVETPLEDDIEEWRQWIHEDEDFDTDLWFLAMDGDEIAGLCQCYPFSGEDRSTGLVDELGVRRAWRKRGLATALLRHAFRTFYDRGVPNVELGVDAENPTGATRLYERAGMRLVWKSHVYELKLRASDDTATEI
jgi:ribosomal protein S18 acetylase RimI-like enzyme